MMRAMYSGVAGLRTHQTKMDVIGNNIANVNTVAFKSSSTTFSEIMYQNLSGASGATANGRGGVNAKQIGLGVTTGSTTVNITGPGATQTTGDAFDLAITGDSFFVVNDGVSNYFTKAGAFYIDGAGNLAMKSNGYNVMGWQVDPNTGLIRKDTVTPLRIMTPANMTSPPEATTNGICAGILDKNSPQVNTDDGYIMNLNFFDALGYSYTAKFAVKSTNVKGEYTVELTDIIDINGVSIKDLYNAADLADLVKFGEQTVQTERVVCSLQTGYTYTPPVAPATEGTYYKTVTFPDIAANYDTDKVTGFTYAPGYYPGGTAGSVTVPAEMKMSATMLGETYGVIYDANAGAYYKNGQQITTAAQWMTALNVDPAKTNGDFAFNMDADGAMTFTFTQTFQTVPGLVDNSLTPGGSMTYSVPVTQAEAYGMDITDPTKDYAFDVAPNGAAIATVTTTLSGNILKFNTDDGLFMSIGGMDSVVLDFNANFTDREGNVISLQNFSDVDVDFTQTKWFENGGTSTMGTEPGGIDGTTGKGKKMGDLIGLSVSNDGTIWGAYDNGNTVLLGQIAVAVFANPSGLEKVGENCYQTTLNSGEFDGIGQDITADGGKMTSGVLEMSNVDLSAEFTEMITTQRGFQANSRIITTSDTLLEELINLKR